MSKRHLVAGAPDIDADKTIAELFHAIEELVSRRKRPGELAGLIDEAKTLASEWKDPRSAKHPKHRRPLFDGTSGDTNFLLAALVVVLMRDHEVLKRIRRHCPNELEDLISTSGHRELRALVSAISGTLPKTPPKRKYERTRRSWRRSSSNSIEYQFGGDGESEWRKSTFSGAVGEPYEPTCLDDIFAGQSVNMMRLENLFFGINRHRLLKAAAGVTKKKGLYDHHAVVKIIGILLSKRPRKKRKGPGRPKVLWLDGADLRTRVLSGIERRVMSIATELLEIDQDKALQWQKEIADPFLDTVRGYRC